MNTYQQLTQAQRYQIYAHNKMGHNQTEIAKVIGVHKATISRELGRNCGQRGYRPKQAHRLAFARRNKAKRRICFETWRWIEKLIRLDWSPEQISGRLKAEHDMQVSHEWIYQHILADKRAGGTLHKHLRCQKIRRKRYGSYDRRGKLPNRVSIDVRPEIVDQRKRLGDWEIDTIIAKGQQNALLSLTERKSRLALLHKIDRRTAQAVKRASLHLLDPLDGPVHTITADNGKEFAHHELIAQHLQADFYFAHPHAAWERGTNENMNGLVRQYFPKDTDFASVSDEEVDLVIQKLNMRPRKCLDFKTPFEVFSGQPLVALTS